MTPLGPYKDYADCLAQNQDKSNPEAFCAWLEHQLTGSYSTASLKAMGMPAEVYQVYLQHYGESLNSSTEEISKAEATAHKLASSECEKLDWSFTRIGWLHNYEAPKMRMVTGVKIFATGEWTDSMGQVQTWKDSDLDKMVEAFNAGVPAIAPLKAGHTLDSFNGKIAEELGVPVDLVTGTIGEGQGQVSLGRMATLERRGNLLLASFERVPEKVADLIESGMFSTVSVEIEDEIGSYGPVITAVALLGVEEPAVDLATLDRALIFGGKREGTRILSFASEITPDSDEKGDASKFKAMLQQLRELFDNLTKGGQDKPPESNEKEGEFSMKDPTKKFQTPEEITAMIGQLLGLPEGIGIQEIAQAIEALKAQATAGEPALKALQDQVTELQDNARVAGYLEHTRKLTAIEGDPMKIATDLAKMEVVSGVEQAEAILKTYQSANEAGALALKQKGTSRNGQKSLGFETEVTEYQKNHPNANRGEATKVIMKSNPGLYREARNESRRLAAELENK